MLTTFGVLRLPSSAPARASARLVDGQGRPFVNYARIAQRRFGSAFAVIPVTNLVEWPSGCFKLEIAALRAAMAHAPAKIRARVRQIADETVRDDQYIPQHPEGLCVFDSAGASCAPLLTTEARGDFGGGTSLDGNATVYADLVPDGVATITLRYLATGQTTGQRYERQRATTVSVINNLAAWKFETDATGENDATPTTLIWRAASGRVIRTIYMGL